MYGVLEVFEVYMLNKEKEVENVYCIVEFVYFGVKKMMECLNVYVVGLIVFVECIFKMCFEKYYLDLIEIRVVFEECGWKMVVGF